MVNGGKVAADLGASLTTSRLVSLGFLSEAQKAGASKYQVDEVLDDRTCPVCEYMNGKTFDVDDQFGRIVQQLSAADPQALKDLAPWPGQSKDDLQELYAQSPEELQGSGLWRAAIPCRLPRHAVARRRRRRSRSRSATSRRQPRMEA